MGAEQPFVNRVRLATTLRAWQQDQGALRLRELRLDLSASWSPTEWWTLVVNTPLQVREQRAFNLETQTAAGWGELDLMSRFVVAGAGQARPKALVSVSLGLRLPTALTVSDARRERLDVDAQLGPGAVAPQLAVAWSGFFGDRWSAMASLLSEVPLQGRYGLRMGPSATLVALTQFQPISTFGFRAGADVRAELPSMEGANQDSRLSGVLGSILADVIFRVGTRVLVLVGVRAPVVDTRPGPVRTWPIPLSSVVVDL